MGHPALTADQVVSAGANYKVIMAEPKTIDAATVAALKKGAASQVVLGFVNFTAWEITRDYYAFTGDAPLGTEGKPLRSF